MKLKIVLLGSFFSLTGCVNEPLGPSVAVMPAPGKPFDLFVSEDDICRGFAERQVGVSPDQATEGSVVNGSMVGTAVGAVAGTAIGAAVGHPGEGAAIGAGTGLIQGTAIGAGNSHRSSWNTQQRYNIAYEQCMYAKGNQIPGVAVSYSAVPATVPPPPSLSPSPSLSLSLSPPRSR